MAPSPRPRPHDPTSIGRATRPDRTPHDDAPAHGAADGRGSRSELTLLADTAVKRGAGKPVAVVRGFDRTSRSRAAALRRKLAGQGVPTVDVTPMVLTVRYRRSILPPTPDPQSVGVVVDLGTPTARSSQRLAAECGVPLLRTGAAARTERRSVLGVFVADCLTAVALEAVELRPQEASGCRVRIRIDDGPSTTSSGPRRFRLRPDPGSPGRSEATTSGEVLVGPSSTVTLAPHWGPHTLVVDDEPLAPLTAPVTLRCLVGRLEQVRP